MVLPSQSTDDLELMKERRDRLQRGEPVRAQLNRQAQAFRPSPNAQRFELPPEFYNLSAEELKKEQQQRYRRPQRVRGGGAGSASLKANTDSARTEKSVLALNHKVRSDQDISYVKLNILVIVMCVCPCVQE